MDVATFEVTRLIVHDVPQAEEGVEEPTLTDAPIDLDAELRRYFKRKIVQSLITRGLDVVADPLGSSIVRDAAAAVLRNRSSLVRQSHLVARHLFESQTRRNPPGLLAFGVGAVADGDVVAILKLEREQGLRFAIREVGGRNVVDLELLRELTLTDKTRIFKTTLLRLRAPDEPVSLYGRASDDQRGRDEIGIADFFLSTFLGCQLEANPAKATRDFVSSVEEFINNDVPAPERRAEYLVALQAKLQDQTLDITPRQFAASSIRAQDRPALLERVNERGLSVNVAFQKDLTLVQSGKFKIVFEHGMVLLGAPDDINSQRLNIENSVNGARVQINDGIARLQGR